MTHNTENNSNNDEDFSELERKFISQDDLEKSELKASIERVMSLCEIDGTGMVRIKKTGLTTSQQIALVLATRYLANRLHKKMGKESQIKDCANPEELAKITKLDKASVQARAKELKDNGIIQTPSQGVYQIIPSKILQVINAAEKKSDKTKK